MINKNYTKIEFLADLQKADKFRYGFGKLPDPMIITNEDGVILFVNEAMTERTGFSRQEIIGRTPGKLWGNQKDEGFYQYMWETIKVDKKSFTSDMVNRRKDGTYYGCELKIYPIEDDLGNSFFVGIETKFNDVI